MNDEDVYVTDEDIFDKINIDMFYRVKNDAGVELCRPMTLQELHDYCMKYTANIYSFSYNDYDFFDGFITEVNLDTGVITLGSHTFEDITEFYRYVQDKRFRVLLTDEEPYDPYDAPNETFEPSPNRETVIFDFNDVSFDVEVYDSPISTAHMLISRLKFKRLCSAIEDINKTSIPGVCIKCCDELLQDEFGERTVHVLRTCGVPSAEMLYAVYVTFKTAISYYC